MTGEVTDEQIMSGMKEHRQAVSAKQVMLSERDLAARWCMSRRTLQRLRAQRRGPPWLILGGTVRYRVDDILEYENRMQQGAQDA